MRVKLITGVTGDQSIGPCNLRTVRVAGTANLVGAVQVKQGGTVIETIAAATVPGVERDWDDTAFDATAGVLAVNMANAGDSVLIFYT